MQPKPRVSKSENHPKKSALFCHLKSILVRLLIALPAFAFLSMPGIANMPFLTEKEDAVIDVLMEAFQAAPPLENAIPLAFIDIDDRTHRIWDEPLQLPRDKLLSLIQFAVAAEARVVYVDIELSRPSCQTQGDQKLLEFFKSYKNQSDPPIILPQGIRAALGDDPPSLRPSFLDVALNDPNSRALRASALFDVDDDDGVLRRWRLYERIGETVEGLLPSTELLIHSLVRAPLVSPREVLADLQRGLAGTAPTGLLKSMNLRIHSGSSRLSQRIVYSIPTELPPWRSAQEVPRADGVMVPYLETISASCITDSNLNPNCQRSYPTGLIAKSQVNWVKGRIVVIGASALEARDFFDTPLGVLPGSMVILNAISTLDQNGIIDRPPLLIGMLIEMLVIVAGYALHALLAPKSNSFLFMAGVSILLLPLCYVLFKYGVWLTLALPLFLSTVTDAYEDIRIQFRVWVRSRKKRQTLSP
ncbi:MAG: hypothetical protein RLZ25_1171 [Pseudomonadota bacterium]|jgi:CHASE2 domain-containing sensor protein